MTNEDYNKAIDAAINHMDGKYVVPSIRETIVDAIDNAISDDDKAILSAHLAWVDDNADLNDALTQPLAQITWDQWYALDAAYRQGILDADGCGRWDYCNDAIRAQDNEHEYVLSIVDNDMDRYDIEHIWEMRDVLDNYPYGGAGTLYEDIIRRIKMRRMAAKATLPKKENA